MRATVVLVSMIGALVLGACGSGGEEGVGPVPIPTTTTEIVPLTPGSEVDATAPEGTYEDECHGFVGSCEEKYEFFRDVCASTPPKQLAREHDAKSMDPEDIAQAVAEVSVTSPDLEDIARDGCLEGLGG